MSTDLTPKAGALREKLAIAIRTSVLMEIHHGNLPKPSDDELVLYIARTIVEELGITEEMIHFLDTTLEGSWKRHASFKKLSTALSTLLELANHGE